MEVEVELLQPYDLSRTTCRNICVPFGLINQKIHLIIGHGNTTVELIVEERCVEGFRCIWPIIGFWFMVFLIFGVDQDVIT